MSQYRDVQLNAEQNYTTIKDQWNRAECSIVIWYISNAIDYNSVTHYTNICYNTKELNKKKKTIEYNRIKYNTEKSINRTNDIVQYTIIQNYVIALMYQWKTILYYGCILCDTILYNKIKGYTILCNIHYK